ncbi:chorismate mutase [Pseudalkalibacillus caeni]|uniref:chorismate mutase n=1 Tax=Exobacillus caeni TaxID=2574798 RepID=A0A5R9EYI9_9BACL|nr:chorismate mutase [Pseudalkalibacillus caeni]TLS35911.1 chorismate mutase [Pseudalkalibacillus caeni]
MIRGIRGAITVEKNEKNSILIAVEQLVKNILDLNEIDPENVAQVIITMTKDLDSAFPAEAVRTMDGWKYVPVICASEIPVKGSIEKCIRVLMTVNTLKTQREIHHVYLEKAAALRPDLTG